MARPTKEVWHEPGFESEPPQFSEEQRSRRGRAYPLVRASRAAGGTEWIGGQAERLRPHRRGRHHHVCEREVGDGTGASYVSFADPGRRTRLRLEEDPHRDGAGRSETVRTAARDIRKPER